MKQNLMYVYIGLLFLVLNAFGNSSNQQGISKSIVEGNESFDSIFTEVKSPIAESENYLNNRDFDGDNISDIISFRYTGGAHCCYIMSLKLSSKKDTIKYPFEMDGGFEFGIVDGSQHDQFNIDDFDQDGLAEIFMEISTYNGEKYPIKPEWTEKYGIKTNYIIFDYNEGEVVLFDYDRKKHIAKPKQH
jgi:hypothetical protein